jgi:hypothetical protein
MDKYFANMRFYNHIEDHRHNIRIAVGQFLLFEGFHDFYYGEGF